MDRSLWTDLREADDAVRFGPKAATLARLARAGLPVVEGCVLDAQVAARALDDPPILQRAVAELLRIPACPRWILRSSSPLEDQPGQSAAGWFATVSANASADELARALREVLRSARSPRLVERLGSVAPLAVLAQEHLDLDRWCTAELRDGETFYEGWAGDGEPWIATRSQDFDPVVRAAAECTGIEPALFELGLSRGSPLVLQIRPAPSRAPQRLQHPTGDRSFQGLGPRVHPGDERLEWIADLEHCPTPLSVLLATAFGRWIAADPGHSSSRLIHGRWHDPAGEPESSSREEARAAWERWRHQLAERVEPARRALESRQRELGRDPARWRRFLDAWFALQRAYFAMPGRRARTWARRQLASGRAGLALTPATERIDRWNALRTSLMERVDAPASSAEAIARWVDEHADDALAERILATARRDRAVAPLPYDGFTPGLDEDPWPLYRALASGLPRPAARGVPDPDDDLAASILALAETDNELLLEAYAIWRAAVRHLAVEAGRDSAAELHMLDVTSLEAWLDSGEFPEAAARRGRALHAAWAVAGSVDAPDDDTIRGIAAAGGTGRGPVARGRSLLELEGEGQVAVVDTLGPADAIAVPRFAAIVCAAGDVLGHASVLCREFGVPCVVQVPGARQRLARASELFVDGDHGVVRIVG